MLRHSNNKISLTVDEEFYQVEGLIESENSNVENGWKRNGQKHRQKSDALRAASIFENARDVIDTRIVFVQKAESQSLEQIIE